MAEDQTPELRTSRCRSCGAEIVWGVSATTGKRMPVERVPANGNLNIAGYTSGGTPVLVAVGPGQGPYVSHFVRCPQAGKWRR